MRLYVLCILSSAIINSCGTKEKEVQVPIEVPEFHSLTPIKKASKNIQDAAKAVVLINNFTGSSGTGSFISANGLLMTNEHVTGISNCPKEGCYIELGFDFQNDLAARFEKVFAEPVAIVPKLDLSVYQIYREKGSSKLPTPNFLQFSKRSGESLIEEEVFLVGHPHGELKKWSKGKVYSHSQDWFSSDIYALPGNSGSPMLNSKGEIIGLVHRSQLNATFITRNGYRGATIATNSQAVMESLDISEEESLSLASLDSVIQTDSLVSFEDINSENYFSHASLFIASERLPSQEHTSLTEGEHPFLSVYEDRCDPFLNSLDTSAPLALSDLGRNLQIQCLGALSWVDCSEDAKKFSICPNNKDQWIERVRNANLIMRENNIGGNTLQFTAQRLQLENSNSWSQQDYIDFISEIEVYSQEIKEETNFYLAYIKTIFTYGTQFEDKELTEYAIQYKKQPGYYRYYPQIIAIADRLELPNLKGIIKEALNHPETTLSEKLQIETNAYLNDLL